MTDSLRAYIGQHKIINGEYIDLDKVTLMPKIKFVPESNTYYTTIMVDPDAPSKTNPIYKYWIHLLIINNNEGIIEFANPNPPKGSGPHRYIIYLFKQENKLGDIHVYSRNNFDLDKFISTYNLTLVGNIMFITERK